MRTLPGVAAAVALALLAPASAAAVSIPPSPPPPPGCCNDDYGWHIRSNEAGVAVAAWFAAPGDLRVARRASEGAPWETLPALPPPKADLDGVAENRGVHVVVTPEGDIVLLRGVEVLSGRWRWTVQANFLSADSTTWGETVVAAGTHGYLKSWARPDGSVVLKAAHISIAPDGDFYFLRSPGVEGTWSRLDAPPADEPAEEPGKEAYADIVPLDIVLPPIVVPGPLVFTGNQPMPMWHPPADEPVWTEPPAAPPRTQRPRPILCAAWQARVDAATKRIRVLLPAARSAKTIAQRKRVTAAVQRLVRHRAGYRQLRRTC
jgi:hypothetical protein